MVPVTVNGAEVGRLPQSELSIKPLLASIKGKVNPLETNVPKMGTRV